MCRRRSLPVAARAYRGDDPPGACPSRPVPSAGEHVGDGGALGHAGDLRKEILRERETGGGCPGPKGPMSGVGDVPDLDRSSHKHDIYTRLACPTCTPHVHLDFGVGPGQEDLRASRNPNPHERRENLLLRGSFGGAGSDVTPGLQAIRVPINQLHLSGSPIPVLWRQPHSWRKNDIDGLILGVVGPR